MLMVKVPSTVLPPEMKEALKEVLPWLAGARLFTGSTV